MVCYVVVDLPSVNACDADRSGSSWEEGHVLASARVGQWPDVECKDVVVCDGWIS